MKERIKELCKLKGVSMNTAESEMCLAKGYLSKLGKSNPNAKTLQKMADYFGVSVKFILTGEQESMDKEAILSLKDERDIAKDMENIRKKIMNGSDGPLSYDSRAGCYMFLKNHKCVFLNEDLSENEMRLVMAHELAHSIMHRKENCYFIRNKTLMLTSKVEIEANIFAAELLIPDELILEHPGMPSEQLAKLVGYNERIIRFKKIQKEGIIWDS